MKMGYWGLGGGSQIRRQFSIQARAKNYKHLTSFALRDLIQEKIGTSENVEFVTLIDPEHWDYYRAEL
jgi:DNA-dependent RNA polymerase auxiliary subunit epsilon